MLRLRVNVITQMLGTYSSVTLDTVRSVHSSDFVCNTNRTANCTALRQVHKPKASHAHSAYCLPRQWVDYWKQQLSASWHAAGLHTIRLVNLRAISTLTRKSENNPEGCSKVKVASTCRRLQCDDWLDGLELLCCWGLQPRGHSAAL